MFAVIVEFANRVADRSPPLKSTSTASALAMLMTLSVIALTSSREYIGMCRQGSGRWTVAGGSGYYGRKRRSKTGNLGIPLAIRPASNGGPNDGRRTRTADVHQVRREIDGEENGEQ